MPITSDQSKETIKRIPFQTEFAKQSQDRLIKAISSPPCRQGRDSYLQLTVMAGDTALVRWAERKWKGRHLYVQSSTSRPHLLSYQNKWPHMLMTASLAGSKQMLHSNVARSRSLSPLAPPLLLPLGPSPSLLPPAVNPPLLAGPPSLEDRGPAAAIIFNVQARKLTQHNPAQSQPNPG